jgi:alcohol dehydrogenase class IV
MAFEFATASRIIFGAGSVKQIGAIAAPMGKRAFLTTGHPPERVHSFVELLKIHGIECDVFPVPCEPTTDLVRTGLMQAREAGCDLVIGFGGGSALDVGKAVAALLTNAGELLDYLEVIGRGKPITQPSAPYLAVPTTAGTGTEVTRNAVLASTEHQVKVSLRSPHMLPRVALVDPELTYSLPPEVTATTGLDALTQVIEPYVSIKANPMTDALCLEGMRRAARSLRQAFENGNDAAAREDMSLASLFGGLALANAGLGAVHGFAAPVGGMFPAPHGAVCARLLAPVMETNVQALSSRMPASDALRRYDEVAKRLTGDDGATARQGILWLHELCHALRIPALSSYGITGTDLALLVEKAAVASSMQANPIKLTAAEMAGILRAAL